jgi:hypothetical protein
MLLHGSANHYLLVQTTVRDVKVKEQKNVIESVWAIASSAILSFTGAREIQHQFIVRTLKSLAVVQRYSLGLLLFSDLTTV